MSSAARRVLVMIPTYDERESLPGALARLADVVPEVDVLVVDDGSPDGTADLAEQISADDAPTRGRKAIHVLRRTAKQGLGRAYLAAFGWGLEHGYDLLVEMDADGSHRAQDLPALLAAADDADLVIGSRWIRGGSVVNWPWYREVLSRGANTYTRLAIGMPVRDATAGFRAYRADLLRSLPLDEVSSHGYGFQVDMTLRALRQRARVVEVPITFVEREQGVSKMSNAIIVEALVNVTRWGMRERSRQVAGAFRRAKPAEPAGE
jgi:dolichol-phosphate mannosyltransferase